MPHMVWVRTRLYLSILVYLPSELDEKYIVASSLLNSVPREDGNDISLAWIMCTCLYVYCTREHIHSASMCCFLLLCDVMLLPLSIVLPMNKQELGAPSICRCASWEACDTPARWVCLKHDNPFSYPGATWCFLHTQLQCCWPNSFRP